MNPEGSNGVRALCTIPLSGWDLILFMENDLPNSFTPYVRIVLQHSKKVSKPSVDGLKGYISQLGSHVSEKF